MRDHFYVGIHHACAVGGHGIPSSLVDGTMDANRKLFSLPLEQKQALLADENNRGWTPFGEVRTL